MKQALRSFINKLPYVRGLYHEVSELKRHSYYPPGHYYSPIPSMDEVRHRENEIWGASKDGIEGIDLNTTAQLELVKELSQYYGELPFEGKKKDSLRFYFDNDYYSYTDGIILYSMLRHLRPKRIIEVGSGYSSALMLDVNDLYFGNSIQFAFIEPETFERLDILMTEKDKANTEIFPGLVQDVDPAFFDRLKKGDVLFIDSTHVVKTGSDVNYLLFKVLPRLKNGVLIHIHDIFYPFEYPKEWVYRGWNWNEDYFIRAFLMYNNAFEIRLFSHYLHVHHPNVFKDMALTYKNTGGSLWLEKK